MRRGRSGELTAMLAGECAVPGASALGAEWKRTVQEFAAMRRDGRREEGRGRLAGEGR